LIKTLVSIGDGVGIELEEAMPRQLGIDRGSRLEVSTDGQTLVIRPVSDDREDARQAHVLEAADRVTDIHAEWLRKLAL